MVRILRALCVGVLMVVFLGWVTSSVSNTISYPETILLYLMGVTAFGLACAAGGIALLAMARRRQWGWFALVIFALLLDAYGPTLAAVLLPYIHLGLYDQAASVVAAIVAPAAVLLYASIPFRRGHSGITEGISDTEVSLADEASV